MNLQLQSTLAETAELIRRRKLVERLRRSPLFESYAEVFSQSTGMPLEIVAAEEKSAICGGAENSNRFCSMLNEGKRGCAQCLVAQHCLLDEGDRRVKSISCFAGLRETAVPLVVHGQVVAILKTGQVFNEKPSEGRWAELEGELEGEKEGLREAYFATPVVEKVRYQAMVTLLAAFSLQFTKMANHIDLEEENQSDDPMMKARDYIEENLTEPIELSEIAEYLGMSTFHFCRRFKESTGLTLTHYVTDKRVEMAKETLVRSKLRITDIAYEVGFQSLSQFNRSFQKVTGMSPSAFRREELAAVS